MSATLVEGRGTTRNGTGRHLDTIAKRDGRQVPFDQQKIFAAVKRCFVNGTHTSEDTAQNLATQVSTAAINVLKHHGEPVSVEHVQRVVIQQLWAQGHFEAAEHYQNYREERRRARERRQAIDPADTRRITEDAKHFPTPIQYFQFLDKYARWNEVKGRRETWRECCDRVFTFLRSRPVLNKVPEETWAMLDSAVYGLQVSPAMRIVQMAGPALERCNSGAFNCCYTACDDLIVFPEVLYLLMQGCGVGFSVESHYVDQLPRIKKQKGSSARTLRIDDSTEGWCHAYREGILAWANGDDVVFDYSQIRPEGTRLSIKGGYASGAQPLQQLLDFTRDIFLRRQGSWLRTRDCHDILCMTGKIVQVGGVRRASEISLSDLDDTVMRDAKSGNWWDTSPWLDMANNSAVYQEKPDAVTFMTEWLALAKSGSGERGIFNRHGLSRQIPKRRKKVRFGINPCGEVILRSCQMCNLSIVVARPNDTPETLSKKVELAAILGTLQSTLTQFSPFLRDIWRQNCDEERLLGVDITGQMDCPLLRPGVSGREELLKSLGSVVLRTNETWAALLGIPVSAATTVVKPSGNSALFFGCSSGMHSRWSKRQLRRVRINRYSPMAALLRDEGVPYATDPFNETLLVFDFLMEAPPGTLTRNDMTAIEQFRNWLVWKENWTEHNPSATVYVGPDEWLELGAEVYKHFDMIGGLTFLPKDGGTYQLPPNEELTEDDYATRRNVFPNIHWEKLSYYEERDMTTPLAEIACAGGRCELS
jgi:ribonucleoside-diphosphate reductase alpha chain